MLSSRVDRQAAGTATVDPPMADLAHRRPWQVAAAGCLLVLLVAGAVALLRGGGPSTTLGRTEAWLTQTGCAAATPHETRLPLRPFPRVHPDFDNRARRYVAVECEHAGGYVIYEHFATPAALAGALAHSRSIRRTTLCLKGADAIHSETLERGQTTGDLCRYLHGRLRRRPEPPCHHPGSLPVRRYDRIAAREDAGAPCAFGTRT
jgi:hypothetical protein